MIRDLIIKDVRCFAGEQRINIRPLTFLVGENSTGKSTALGCFHTLATIHKFSSNGGGVVDFNQEPYRMGSFFDIVRRDQDLEKNKFSLGLNFCFEVDIESLSLEILLEFVERGSEPSLSVVTLLFPSGGKIIFNIGYTSDSDQRSPWSIYDSFEIDKPDGETFIIRITTGELFFVMRDFPFFLIHILEGKKRKPYNVQLQKFLQKKFSLQGESREMGFQMRHLFKEMPQVTSMAPIRSKPQRTYDSLSEIQTPEGSDVPMFLMRLKRTGDKREKQIRKALADFGKQSGLFDAVDVKPYGQGMHEPFQLQVKVRKVNANILDVGYGVSQLLPILVRIFTALSPTYFLLQQPEVHLHPRGQAELASLFITSISKHEQKFIIETHSDYMVKRARIEIRNKRINPDDIALVYFEPEGNKINVHNIGFDESGNLMNTPDSYQHFFLDESDRFLGFKD